MAKAIAVTAAPIANHIAKIPLVNISTIPKTAAHNTHVTYDIVSPLFSYNVNITNILYIKYKKLAIINKKIVRDIININILLLIIFLVNGN